MNIPKQYIIEVKQGNSKTTMQPGYPKLKGAVQTLIRLKKETKEKGLCVININKERAFIASDGIKETRYKIIEG